MRDILNHRMISKDGRVHARPPRMAYGGLILKEK